MADHAVQKVERTIIVGVDVGTQGTGYAYCHAAAAAGGGNATPRLREEWPDQPDGLHLPKTRSTLLYEQRTPVAWGWSACKQAAADGDQKLHFAENFKLDLSGEAASNSRQRLPAGINGVQATADFLLYLRKFIMEDLRSSGAVHPDQVQWCLTVPAMWTDAAKAKVRQAALRAGLIRQADSDALQLILEPEAAVLHASRAGSDVRPGDVCLVVDAGGGTVDVTLHRVVGQADQAQLAEAAVGAGGFCGSTFVDARWDDLLRTAAGGAVYAAWQEADPQEVLWVQAKWEAIKCAWDDAHAGAGPPPHVLLPPRLLQRMTASGAAAALAASQGGAGDRVLLPGAAMRGLFDPVVKQVLDLALAQRQRGLAAGHECTKVLLVGGFAESAYLQRRVRAAMGAVPVVVPQHPAAAVLQGAVLYGLQPELVASRRSRNFYGVGSEAPLSMVPPAVAAASRGRFTHAEEGTTYMSDLFTRFVERGQVVLVDDDVEHYAIPVYSHQTEVILDLYATDNADAVCTTHGDMQKVATLHLQLPAGWAATRASGAPYLVLAKLHFGRTEITMTAQDVETGQALTARVVFAHTTK